MRTKSRTHSYAVSVRWTGDLGAGTSGYRAYSRDHEVRAMLPGGPPAIPASSDPAFLGDPAKWNSELLLTATLAQCHMLWYLHLCADAGVRVTGYADHASGTLTEDPVSGGRFTEVMLRPQVVVASADMTAAALELHELAHTKCFIANSVSFPVRHEPVISVQGTSE